MDAPPRLSARVWTGALLRRVQAEGGFATVIVHGDDVSGSVALVHRARDGGCIAYARSLGPAGAYVWRSAVTDGITPDAVDKWVERQRRFDPDLWVIELDTPNLARFVDETIVND